VADIRIADTAAAPVNGWVPTFTFGGDQKVTLHPA
jgi:hypothetical protein